MKAKKSRTARDSLAPVFVPIFAFILALSLAIITSPDADARKKKRETLMEALTSKIDASLVKVPVDEDVCFSPDELCDVKLVKFIDSAKESIDLAIFDVNLDQVVHHLLVQSRKIPVRIIVDRRQSKGEHSLVKTLIKGGIKVKIGRQRGIMHNKFMIVDGKMLQTGSFNYSNGAAENNAENQIYLAKPAIIARYKERFEKLWSIATEPKHTKE